GLYDPANEHDACGVAFVATLRGAPTREIVEAGLTALKNLDHRGAVGAEEDTGDGAGILLQVPDAFLRAELGFELPDPGHYAVGMAFLPGGTGASTERAAAVAAVERIAAEEGLRVLGWREVPVVADLVGPMARSTMPALRHLVVTDADGQRQGLALDRLAYRLRKRAEHEVGVYLASLSSR